MEFLIVSGRAGAGKTQALNVLEDMGYFCIDNIPPSLIPVFATMADTTERFSKVVVVTDVRAGDTSEEIKHCLKELEKKGILYKILFLECSDDVLVKRYRETRRKHPLMFASDISVLEAIKQEKTMLNSIHEIADYIIDTSNITVKQLRQQLFSMFSNDKQDVISIRLLSFGYKYGVPTEADLVLDVRCLPNPFYEESLRNKTGLDEDVRDYVFRSESTKEVLNKLYSLLDTLLPLYIEEGKTQLVIGIGCTGGRHRSVAITEELKSKFVNWGYSTQVIHRDIGKVTE